MLPRSRAFAHLPQWATILILVVVAILWVREEFQKTSPASGPVSAQAARCVNVIDGDTLDVQWPGGKRERVRVLGIDCMESHNKEKRARQAKQLGVNEGTLLQMSKQATRLTRDTLLNQSVTLVFPEGTPTHDPYQRLLGYVEYQDRDLGAMLLEQGLAEARREPHPRKAHYQALNREAKAGRVGIYR